MFNQLTALYNTMLLIETKGESTKVMSSCLTYLDQLIKQEKENESKKPEPDFGSKDEVK